MVLSADGKVEASFQGSGKLLGVEINEFYTAIISPQQGGALFMEGNGIITSKDGKESESLKFQGVGRALGAGFKARYYGGTFGQTTSPKFAKLNNAMTVWEVDVDEAGNWHLKIWEWK